MGAFSREGLIIGGFFEWMATNERYVFEILDLFKRAKQLGIDLGEIDDLQCNTYWALEIYMTYLITKFSF